MGGTELALPLVWAQAPAVATSATANPTALAPLALRRWCASLTLSSPESVPSLHGLWVLLASLGALLVLAMVFQGPGKALGQLLDIPGNVRLAIAAGRRLRRAGRLLSAVVGLTVLSWTGSQALVYGKSEGRDDMVQLTRARHLVELAVEQGVLAGLTPLRDVASLGSNLPLLLVATLIMFRASADLWGGANQPAPWVKSAASTSRGTGWTNAACAAGALLILYRLVSLGTGMSELPLGGCLMVEALVVPAIMAVCDGLLLAWALVELRSAGFGRSEGESLDVRAVIELVPGSIVACLVALPARYLATAVLLAWIYVPTSTASTAVGSYVRWQLMGQGLTDLQGLALLCAGVAGAIPWGPGTADDAFRGYRRLLAAQGGLLVGALVLAALAAGVVSAAAYFVVLALPAASWVLNAADSYAHYATLAVGLWLLSALVELGERSLPEAELASSA